MTVQITTTPTANPSSGPPPNTPRQGSTDEVTRYCVNLWWLNFYEFHKKAFMTVKITTSPNATLSSGPPPNTPRQGSTDEVTRYCVNLWWLNFYEFHKKAFMTVKITTSPNATLSSGPLATSPGRRGQMRWQDTVYVVFFVGLFFMNFTKAPMTVIIVYSWICKQKQSLCW